MSAKPKPTPAPKVTEADTAQLCRLFSLTSARIGQLAKDGIIYKTERNKYDLWRSVRGYIEYLQRSRHDAGGSEGKQSAELRKIRAQADKLEHELEIQRGKYVSHESQLKAGMQLGLVLKNIFLKMKGELTPRVAGRKASEVSKILDEYARAKLTELSHYESDIKIPAD